MRTNVSPDLFTIKKHRFAKWGNGVFCFHFIACIMPRVVEAC